MRPFINFCIGVFTVPIFWLFGSIVFQRFVYNPVGNPEVKYQLAQLEGNSVVFVGPSTFHRRIDCEELAQETGQSIFTVTSDGQSLIESAQILKIIHASLQNTRIILAGQDMKIKGRGLHQCWACSNLDASLIFQNYDSLAVCFWYDAFLGLLAAFISPKPPLPALKVNQELDGDWLKWHKKFVADKDSVLEQFAHKLSQNVELPHQDFYETYIQDDHCEILIPLDGNFYNCPESFGIKCSDFTDSTWIRVDYWQDASHINSAGSEVFNVRILDELFVFDSIGKNNSSI